MEGKCQNEKITDTSKVIIKIILVYIDTKIYKFDTNYNIRYLSKKYLNFGFMPSKIPIDVKTLKINGFLIYIEYYDSEIIVKDENGNSMSISKKNNLSIILNLNGNFKSD